MENAAGWERSCGERSTPFLGRGRRPPPPQGLAPRIAPSSGTQELGGQRKKRQIGSTFGLRGAPPPRHSRSCASRRAARLGKFVAQPGAGENLRPRRRHGRRSRPRSDRTAASLSCGSAEYLTPLRPVILFAAVLPGHAAAACRSASVPAK